MRRNAAADFRKLIILYSAGHKLLDYSYADYWVNANFTHFQYNQRIKKELIYNFP